MSEQEITGLALEWIAREERPSRDAEHISAFRAGYHAAEARLTAELAAARELLAAVTAALESLRPMLDECINAENEIHGIRGTGPAKKTIRYVQSKIASALLVFEPTAAAAVAAAKEQGEVT